MKVNNNSKRAIIAICATLFFAFIGLSAKQLQAQTNYTLAAGSKIEIAGTSNLHDWTMAASDFSCDAKITVAGDKLKAIHSLNAVLPVKNLKSKESLMDTRTYKTLNADAYDKMTFKLTSASVVAAQKIVKVTGNLTVAGVTKSLTLQASYVVNADESINFKGSKAIKMSDFDVKAPSFMFGALTTGDDLMLNITLNLKK